MGHGSERCHDYYTIGILRLHLPVVWGAAILRARPH